MVVNGNSVMGDDGDDAAEVVHTDDEAENIGCVDEADVVHTYWRDGVEDALPSYCLA